MMADPVIKPDPAVKPDPDSLGASPAAFTDEDIYEDAGDLDFNTDPQYQRLYLARVPNYLWEEWSKLDDDAEIQIGTIRQSSVTGPDGSKRDELRMLIRPEIAQHQFLPKEYDLQVTSEAVQNTFIFTEQDLPGFKSKSNSRIEPDMPAWLNRDRNKDRGGTKQPYNKNKRFEPYYRRAIPKKTTLLGKVAHEVNCVAVNTPETDRILAERTFSAMQPQKKTVFVRGDGASNLERGFIQPGTIQAGKLFNNFIKNTTVTKGGKTTQESKTARMPRNDLLDLIFACFRQYKYWSMKALRAKLQQPEAYLREVLEGIADMPKSGRFASNWTLKPEYSVSNYEGSDDAVAPSALLGTDGVDDSDVGDGEDDDDDENLKMEDVMPS